MIRMILSILFIILLAACLPARPIPSQPAATFSQLDQSTTSPDQGPGISVSGVENPYLPQETDNTLQRDTVTIQSKDLLVQETFPLQYTLVLKGTLPTPCHELRVAIDEPDVNNRLNLEVYSVVDPDVACIQVVALLDVKIGLNGYPAGKYSVWINGEKVGEMEVLEASMAMKGYELYSWESEGNWYFSLLLGTNRLKSIDEITQADGRLIGIKDLKQALERLSRGEQIIWSSRNLPGLSLPPYTMLDEIRAYCTQLGLQLEVETSQP